MRNNICPVGVYVRLFYYSIQFQSSFNYFSASLNSNLKMINHLVHCCQILGSPRLFGFFFILIKETFTSVRQSCYCPTCYCPCKKKNNWDRLITIVLVKKRGIVQQLFFLPTTSLLRFLSGFEERNIQGSLYQNWMFKKVCFLKMSI